MKAPSRLLFDTGRTTVLAIACAVIVVSLGRSQGIDRSNGRLTARPKSVVTPPPPGRSALSFGRSRDGVIYIPAGLPREPVPLVLLLHGAGGSSMGIDHRLGGTADSLGFVLLVPDSRGPTWDAIRGEYGPDIAFIDSALKVVFSRVSIDPTRIIVSGFSDGASYALGLGRINGDLFSKIVAFSPGFIPEGGAANGKPEVYITHGDNDQILPYESTSQRIVPAMKRAGYSVTLKQFAGGHTVPPDLAVEALRWAVTKREAKVAR